MLLLVTTLARAETWDPGETIDPAAVADITPEGFTAVGALIPALLPSDIPIDTVGDDQGYYAYELSNAKIAIQVQSASIVPGNGVLDVTADLTVAVNQSSDPFSLYYSAIWIIEDTCPGYVDAFAVHLNTTMALEVVDDGSGGTVLDATMGAINVSYELTNDDIHMDCTIGDIEDVLDWFGLSLYDLILGQLDSYLQDTVASIGPTLESTIEDAFSAASISQDLDLNGATAHLELNPSDVQITPAGARIVMGGSMSAEPAACVAAYDPGGSLKTGSGSPDIAEHPSDVPAGFHVVADVTDDFANEALYSLWRGGLLCYTLDENGPVPLSTALLDGMSGGAIGELFPESMPVTLVTRPENAPTVNYQGTHDIDVDVKKLGLDFYTELDGRQARLVGMDLDAVMGVNLALDSSTGHLGIEVAIDGDNVTPSIGYNELVPAANDGLIAGFGGLFDTVVGSLLGGLTEGLGFDLPSFSGIGLTGVQMSANGDNKDWLGLFATLGPVTYSGSSSCGGCGGTDTGGVDTGASASDCGGGCAVVPPVPFSLAMAPMVAFTMLRRRR